MASNIPGERLQTDQYNENTSEHLHRYALVMKLCTNMRVLDIACGEGYGSNLLSGNARYVAGVDIDEETIALAKNKYKRSNLEYKSGSTNKIPFPDSSFDVVISFETLEHHDKHDQMMSEIKRVLVKGGTCFISTPDKLVYSEKKNYKNPYHVKELYKEEFRQLLKKYFDHVTLFNQQFISGSLILPEDEQTNKIGLLKGKFDAINFNASIEAEYLIAIASDSQPEGLLPSIYIDDNFATNKVLQFQRSSLRYKLGNFLLAPIKFIKGKS